MSWKPPRAALAALLLGLLAVLAASPARAGDRGTLRVTARVVEECEIRVPDWVWEHVLRDKAKRAISHRCRGRGPVRIDLDPPGPPPWVHGGRDHRGPDHASRDRSHGRNHDRHARDDDRRGPGDRRDDRGPRTVWVTITY